MCVPNNLSWTDHITGVCSKAKIILFYRKFYTNSSPDTSNNKFMSVLFNPSVEYVTQLWDPYLQRYGICLLKSTHSSDFSSTGPKLQ